MKQQSNNLLTRDHSKLDEMLEQVLAALRDSDSQQAYVRLDHFWARLAMHIRAEQLHLFPALLGSLRSGKDTTKVSSVFEMIVRFRLDHDYFMKELAGLIKLMRELIANDKRDTLPTLADITKALKEFQVRLRAHDRMEETEIYPLVDLIFEPAELMTLNLRIKKELENLPPRFVGKSQHKSADIEYPEGFILIGGASSRMGHDKAKLTIGGRKLFERAADALSLACPINVTLVGKIDSDLVGDVHSINDIPIDNIRAPIVGLYTAMKSATTPWIAILACDLPFVTADLMVRLGGYCSDGFDAVVPVQSDAKPQPLCSFYRRERCLPVVGTMIKSGNLKMQNLLSDVTTRFVEFDEIADLDGSADLFLNVNSPKDYERAIARTAS